MIDIEFFKSFFNVNKTSPIEDAIDRKIFGLYETEDGRVIILLDNRQHIEIFTGGGKTQIAHTLGNQVHESVKFTRCIHL